MKQKLTRVYEDGTELSVTQFEEPRTVDAWWDSTYQIGYEGTNILLQPGQVRHLFRMFKELKVDLT